MVIEVWSEAGGALAGGYCSNVWVGYCLPWGWCFYLFLAWYVVRCFSTEACLLRAIYLACLLSWCFYSKCSLSLRYFFAMGGVAFARCASLRIGRFLFLFLTCCIQFPLRGLLRIGYVGVPMGSEVTRFKVFTSFSCLLGLRTFLGRVFGRCRCCLGLLSLLGPQS